jgi:hypothetical protein
MVLDDVWVRRVLSDEFEGVDLIAKPTADGVNIITQCGPLQKKARGDGGLGGDSDVRRAGKSKVDVPVGQPFQRFIHKLQGGDLYLVVLETAIVKMV